MGGTESSAHLLIRSSLWPPRKHICIFVSSPQRQQVVRTAGGGNVLFNLFPSISVYLYQHPASSIAQKWASGCAHNIQAPHIQYELHQRSPGQSNQASRRFQLETLGSHWVCLLPAGRSSTLVAPQSGVVGSHRCGCMETPDNVSTSYYSQGDIHFKLGERCNYTCPYILF